MRVWLFMLPLFLAGCMQGPATYDGAQAIDWSEALEKDLARWSSPTIVERALVPWHGPETVLDATEQWSGMTRFSLTQDGFRCQAALDRVAVDEWSADQPLQPIGYLSFCSMSTVDEAGTSFVAYISERNASIDRVFAAGFPDVGGPWWIEAGVRIWRANATTYAPAGMLIGDAMFDREITQVLPAPPPTHAPSAPGLWLGGNRVLCDRVLQPDAYTFLAMVQAGPGHTTATLDLSPSRILSAEWVSGIGEVSVADGRLTAQLPYGGRGTWNLTVEPVLGGEPDSQGESWCAPSTISETQSWRGEVWTDVGDLTLHGEVHGMVRQIAQQVS